MSVWADWSDRLEEVFDRWDRREKLLRRRPRDWQLAASYAFDLLSETFATHNVAVPKVTMGLIIATGLATLFFLPCLLMLLGVLPFDRTTAILSWVPGIALGLLYGRVLNVLPINRQVLDNAGKALGLALIALVVVRWEAPWISLVGSAVLALVAGVLFLACVLAWLDAEFRYRFNLLETVPALTGKVEYPNQVVVSAINVVNFVVQLKEAQARGPDAYAQVRSRWATPGYVFTQHPLGLTDQRFEDDLQHLLQGQHPSKAEAA